MIFLAVAVPIPGTDSSCDSVALFRSTGLAGAALAFALLSDFDFLAEPVAVCGRAGAAKTARPMVQARTRRRCLHIISKSIHHCEALGKGPRVLIAPAACSTCSCRSSWPIRPAGC